MEYPSGGGSVVPLSERVRFNEGDRGKVVATEQTAGPVGAAVPRPEIVDFNVSAMGDERSADESETEADPARPRVGRPTRRHRRCWATVASRIPTSRAR